MHYMFALVDSTIGTLTGDIVIALVFLPAAREFSQFFSNCFTHDIAFFLSPSLPTMINNDLMAEFVAWLEGAIPSRGRAHRQ